MKGIRYQPAELTVHPGETVEFKNEDIFAHTVTADDGSFDSGLIQPGSSWKMTVQKAGTLAYHCKPHPNMKAVLVVSSGTQVNERNAAAHGLPGFRPPRSPQELHPILVNFTAALLPLALFSDLLGLWLKRPSLHNAAAWMVLYAAIITPLTGAAGWWWKSQSAGDAPAGVNRCPPVAGNIAGAGLYRARRLAVASLPAKCCSYFALSGVRRDCCARAGISGKPGWSNGFWPLTFSLSNTAAYKSPHSA